MLKLISIFTLVDHDRNPLPLDLPVFGSFQTFPVQKVFPWSNSSTTPPLLCIPLTILYFLTLITWNYPPYVFVYIFCLFSPFEKKLCECRDPACVLQHCLRNERLKWTSQQPCREQIIGENPFDYGLDTKPRLGQCAETWADMLVRQMILSIIPKSL